MAFYSWVSRPAAALNIPGFVPFPWLRESPGLPLFVPQPGNSLKTTGWTLWASCFTLISLGSLYLLPNVQSLKRTSCHMFCFALLCWLFQAGRSICCGGAFFSHKAVSNSLQPHGLQHTRLPCPSSTPGVGSNLCTLSQWHHPTISSSVVPFSSSPQSFPASWSFSVSRLFASGGQSIGASASASI